VKGTGFSPYINAIKSTWASAPEGFFELLAWEAAFFRSLFAPEGMLIPLYHS